jgi:hypothetical protein
LMGYLFLCPVNYLDVHAHFKIHQTRFKIPSLSLSLRSLPCIFSHSDSLAALLLLFFQF